MQNEIRWLVRLCLDQGLVTQTQANTVRAKLGDSADLMDFAQELIDDGHIEDHAILEKIAGLALTKGKVGPPADDPFTAGGPSRATTPPMPARRATGDTAPPFMVTSASEGPPKIPSIPFDMISAMDDSAVAASMRTLLRACARYGASDLHLSAGTKPFIRAQRMLKNLSEHILSEDDSRRLNIALLTPHQRELFEQTRDFDYPLALDATGRFRVNLMVHKAGVSGCYRMVPATIPRLDQLGLRNVEAVRKLLNYHNGLILVTGPVGSGKTTTLAALVAELNESRTDHIITVEDPIEVVQPAKGCNVTQREIGPHTESFATALKGALREDPDVIIIGELRDLETIEMAVTASETGHLVIGTMHTSDAATTLNRLLDVFPPAQQAQIRASVSESLRGILCQRLLPDTSGGLVLATELLVANTAVSALIRDGKTQGLRNVLETGTREGMCLMENVVFELYQKGSVSAETARQNISNRMLRAKIT
ncbi:type IV pilus twitching motility protein PilT [Rariglobus hedericola]|uniref:PilT/PilU family type 4a pilus ATPase n=1 Tax=Rariglobus hedericola TaxID=2597822 RepID=A0A556QJM4_9BACT|nr:PilT/PilU family type 4a pilus ATPase [Rariglobus hedericola]TSJ76850.1 PilT/PilU family type 4a pilus ATPase [Rariglobus hedericola]